MSADHARVKGDVWSYFPHNHARLRASSPKADGLIGFRDIERTLCLGLALWNGVDPMLWERIFGVAGVENTHDEDAAEYWWYVDAVPSRSWNRWRYHYSQTAFSYHDRGYEDEPLDIGVCGGDRYWIIEVDYTKAHPCDVLMTVQVTNAASEDATLHVLPATWFRDSWAWDNRVVTPHLRAGSERAIEISHPLLGDVELLAGEGPNHIMPEILFCDNAMTEGSVYGAPSTDRHLKDGITDYVVHGLASINHEQCGTKAAFHYILGVEPRQTVNLILRLRRCLTIAGSRP